MSAGSSEEDHGVADIFSDSSSCASGEGDSRAAESAGHGEASELSEKPARSELERKGAPVASDVQGRGAVEATKAESSRTKAGGKDDPEIPDPDMSHLTSADFKLVYDPSEDSFLLMDALSLDRKFLASRFAATGQDKDGEAKHRGILAVEIGVGSGIILTHLARLLGTNTGVFLGTDINHDAAMRAQRTLDRNGVRGGVIVTDLVSSIRERIRGKVDVLVFNPPYVPTPSAEVREGGIAAAWAGGIRGREVLDRLLPDVANLLSKRGVFYLVTVLENDPAEVCSILARSGLSAKQIKRRRAFNEDLRIYRFQRADEPVRCVSKKTPSD